MLQKFSVGEISQNIPFQNNAFCNQQSTVA